MQAVRGQGKKYSYPTFGMGMPNRNFNPYTAAGNGYRYGFNGQEKTNEVYNIDGSYLDFDFRGYNSRLGRFMTVDPLSKKYPELTPYQFASNTSIWSRELEGLESWYSNGTATKTDQPGSTENIPAGNLATHGPLSWEYASSQGLVSGDVKGSTFGLVSTLDVFVGSPGHIGGKAGGHAIINLGGAGAFSFSNDAKKDPDSSPTATDGNHFLAKSGTNANSKFKNYDPNEYQKIKFQQGKESVSFTLDLTLDQRQSIIDNFQGKPPVDYAITGFRCASYSLKTLNSLNIINTTDFKAKYFHAVTPGALIRYLSDKLPYQINKGTPGVNFNNPLTK